MFFLRKKVFIAICRAEEQTCALATNKKFISLGNEFFRNLTCEIHKSGYAENMENINGKPSKLRAKCVVRKYLIGLDYDRTLFKTYNSIVGLIFYVTIIIKTM